MISAVIPAYNESERIERVLKETERYVDEIIVIDDNSRDNTAEISERYAEVIRNERNLGYIESLKKGFKEAKGEVIVTLDADGEHDPSYIPELITPIQNNEADLVFGRRERIPRPSERLLSWMAKSKVDIDDPGIGFRAIKKDLAEELELRGYCTCGIFALEAFFKGAVIKEVSTPVRKIEKPKRVAWDHLLQFFVVLKWLIRSY